MLIKKLITFKSFHKKKIDCVNFFIKYFVLFSEKFLDYSFWNFRNVILIRVGISGDAFSVT